MKQLIYNAIRTPDGTVLVSRSRHDFRSYTDANGYTYSVDGGIDYLRRMGPVGADAATDISVYLEDGHWAVRHVLAWGTYGKTGRDPLTWKLLKDMSDDHIAAVLATQSLSPAYCTAFENEQAWRVEHNISLAD